MLALLTAQGTDPLVGAYILGITARLLCIRPEDPTSSPFRIYDVHPFR